MNHDSNSNGADETQLGKDIVMDNLRQICVYQAASDESTYTRFFTYLSHVNQLCGARITDDCHDKALQYTTIPMGFGGIGKNRK